MRVGKTINATASLTVSGGTVLAPGAQIGALTGSQGIVTVSGGTLIATNLLDVGHGVNSTGTVSVTSGQLIATNDVTYVGKAGFGQMSLSGGSATFAFLAVGANMNGLLSISGGQLNLQPRTTNDWMQVGVLGVGQLNVSGGTLLLGDELHVGDDSSGFGTGSGIASMTGGQLIATNDLTAIGRYGPGQMTVSNATCWLADTSVGRHDGATGTLTIQSNAQVYLIDPLSIGRFSNSVGHVVVAGGLLSLTNDTLFVGREGSGDLTLSNGTVRALSGLVAVSTVVTDAVTILPVTNIPSGTLTIAGGSLILTSNLLVGTSLISTGQVSVVGGSLTVSGGGSPGYLAVSSGSFTLNQGSVSADSVLLTNNTGQFVFNAGTLQAKGMTVADGAPFVVGDGIDQATLQLQGGTYTFANGLVISPNATVTGCGTIIGPVTNNGTFLTTCVVITSIKRSGATATLSFTTLAGSNHVLEYKNSFVTNAWTQILPGLVGTGGVMTNRDTNATVPNRLYRIHVQ
jgi:T5SS/PEP-CTERM-associated repeat protein